MEDIKLGDRVKVLGKNTQGKVAFIGETHFADGTWLGIILDEPKGKHNGSVDGKRYFKCPRSYGVFVRSCQIKKETIDEEYVDKTNSISNRISYPNYLKSSSKLKIDKHACKAKCENPIRKTKPRMKFTENEIIEEDYESLMKEKDEELKIFQDENRNLKIKLKNAEQTSQDTLQKYGEANDEIKKLKDQINLKNEQIKLQQYHLKLLKMKQSKHSNHLDIFEMSHTEKNSVDKSNLIKDFDGINSSDDDLDSESLKVLTSMQRVVELEEQNRIMVQGLIELREFLKKNYNQKSTDFGIENEENQQRQKSRADNIGSFSESGNLPSKGKINKLSVEESSHLKKNENILRRKTGFNGMIKDKNKHFLDSNNLLQSQNETLHESYNNINAATDLDISGLQNDPEKFVTTLNLNTKDFQEFSNAAQYQNSESTSKQPSEKKSKTSIFQNTYFGNDKTSLESTNTVTKLKQLISDLTPDAEDIKQYPSANSYKHQDLPFEKNSSHVDQSRDRFGIIDSAVQSNGDNTFVKSSGYNSKRKTFYSAQMHQKQGTGDNN